MQRPELALTYPFLYTDIAGELIMGYMGYSQYTTMRLLSLVRLLTSWVDINTTNTIGYTCYTRNLDQVLCFELVIVHAIIIKYR